MAEDSLTADYVVVGAGSAGCVVAERLSAAGHRVLLLEAGPRDRSPLIHVPAGVSKLMGHRLYDWNYEGEPDRGIGGRRMRFPRGRGLGGTSSINGMNFVRGMPADFDAWAQAGCSGWGWRDVLPHFKAIERFDGAADSATRGQDGPLTVEPYRTVLPITDRFVAAAQAAGYPFLDDLNGTPREGVGYSQMARRGRWRQSSAATFLAKARGRTTLRIVTDALVTRLIFEERRCVGVAYTQGDKAGRALANAEVVLCTGAIGSPHLLQLSGIGPAEGLRAAGIDVLVDHPRVGKNLSDHLCVPVSLRVREALTINQMRRWPRLGWEMLRYLAVGRGALTFGATSASVFCRSRPDIEHPDLQLMFFPGSFQAQNVRAFEDEPGVRISVSLGLPFSRGEVVTRSGDPARRPEIAPNYLSHPHDMEALIAGIRIAREIVTKSSLAAHVVTEVAPGGASQTDEALAAHVRATGTTVHHLAGTCAMGVGSQAVVDPRLRVNGIDGLRIADASIMPQVTTGNINAPVTMIGSKAAELLIEDRRKF